MSNPLPTTSSFDIDLLSSTYPTTTSTSRPPTTLPTTFQTLASTTSRSQSTTTVYTPSYTYPIIPVSTYPVTAVYARANPTTPFVLTLSIIMGILGGVCVMVMIWFCLRGHNYSKFWKRREKAEEKEAAAAEVARGGRVERPEVMGSGALTSADVIEPVQYMRSEIEGFYAPPERTRDGEVPLQEFYAPQVRRDGGV